MPEVRPVRLRGNIPPPFMLSALVVVELEPNSEHSAECPVLESLPGILFQEENLKVLRHFDATSVEVCLVGQLPRADSDRANVHPPIEGFTPSEDVPDVPDRVVPVELVTVW
jgi:hypothetical protein